jgi:hypothetical protein
MDKTWVNENCIKNYIVCGSEDKSLGNLGVERRIVKLMLKYIVTVDWRLWSIDEHHNRAEPYCEHSNEPLGFIKGRVFCSC